MIDTPRTDAAQAEDNGDPSHAFELCRELERERNEAREQRDKLANALRQLGQPCTRSDYSIGDLDRVVCHIANTALAELERSAP